MTISIPTKARAPTTKVFYAEPTEQFHTIYYTISKQLSLTSVINPEQTT